MKFKIQPEEIQIPIGNPFEEDRLDRRTLVNALEKIICSVEGPCVIGVDADWGNGKTTFLRMLHRSLEKSGVPVLNFNAWESDYFSDPFAALATELTERLRDFKGDLIDDPNDQLGTVLAQAQEVLRTRGSAIVRSVLTEIPTVGKALGELVDGFTEIYAEKQMTAYTDARAAVAKFKQSLADLSISTWSNASTLVIMIDELDRCRPSYAIELLEVAKHLFSVPNVVFVLAVNRKELAHSIQALYGPNFDARGYLSRFFDFDLRLPDSNREDFIRQVILKVGIESYLHRARDSSRSEESDSLASLLLAFFGDSTLNLRVISQCIHNLGLVYVSLKSNHWFQGITTAVLMILRTLDRELYYRFIQRRASDQEVINGVFDRLRSDFRDNHFRESCIFEAWLIACQLERDRSFRWINDDLAETPSLKRHKSIREGEGQVHHSSPSAELTRAREIIEILEVIREDSLQYQGVRYHETVERIDLFSDELSVIQSLPLS